jgi:hypothetical protein
MDALTAFGLFAVAAMLVCYALEKRSAWFILAFAGSCGLGSLYGFFQGAWPFGLVEAIWALVVLRRVQVSRSFRFKVAHMRSSYNCHIRTQYCKP